VWAIQPVANLDLIRWQGRLTEQTVVKKTNTTNKGSAKSTWLRISTQIFGFIRGGLFADKKLLPYLRED
jgi:hypothetical protein